MIRIQVLQITKQFPARAGITTALDNVSLDIPAGSLYFLLGPSGCGKTTLLRMIAGFVPPTSGRILFDTLDISNTPPHKRDTGMVFQSYALWPHMTVSQNIAFGLDVRKIKDPQRAQRIRDALALVRLEAFADRRPNQLSGGQQQRVALARALAIRPKCLLLDEPLSNLDAKMRLDMRSEIRRIVKDAGITAIYVTHDQKEALSMADGIAVMSAGRVEQTGTPEQLYRQPKNRFVAGFIGESNFLDATVDTINSTNVLLKTPAGPITARRGTLPLTPNQKIAVAFRPESASIAHDAAPNRLDVNHLQGTRLSSTYLGEIAEHLISLPGTSTPIKIFELNPLQTAATPGPVTLLLPIDQTMLVEN